MKPEDNKVDEELHERIKTMCEELIEHGDAVIILMTYQFQNEEGEMVSRMISHGKGNHYTREGLAFDYAIQIAQGNDGESENEDVQ